MAKAYMSADLQPLVNVDRGVTANNLEQTQGRPQ